MNEPEARGAAAPVVPRRLIDTLEARIASPVQVVRAGPGWGKTTLLRRWLADRAPDRRVLWCAAYPGIDVAGLDLDVLVGASRDWHRLVAESAAADPVQLGLAAARAVSAALEPVLLVFDDLQYVTAPAAQEFLSAFVTRLPDNCHVVLSGRRLPPETEARLGLAFVPALSPADFALTLDETMQTVTALLEGSELSTDTVAELHELTDGWAGGIMAAVQAAEQSGRLLPLHSGELHRVLAGYFEREVLSELTPEARRLLLETSIVSGDFTPALTRVLTGAGSTRPLASAVEASGGFARVDNNGTYHVMPVLRGHLRDEFERSQPMRAALLHRRAAVWYEEQEAVSTAVRHALAAGDAVLAIRLVGFHWLSYARSGREATIGSWVSAIEYVMLNVHVPGPTKSWPSTTQVPLSTLNAGLMKPPT